MQTTSGVIFDPRGSRRVKLDYDSLANKFPQFTFSTNVRNLGVTLDITSSLHISLISLGPVFITCVVYVPFDDLSPRRFFLPWFMPLSVHALTIVTSYLWAYQNSAWLHSNQYLMLLLV